MMAHARGRSLAANRRTRNNSPQYRRLEIFTRPEQHWSCGSSGSSSACGRN